MNTLKLIEIIANLIGACLWPGVVIVLAILFKKQLVDLCDRLKSGEVAGARFTFNAAASGYIRKAVDAIVLENNQQARELLANQVKDVAASLGAIHPISLSLLIEAGESKNMCWEKQAYTSKKQYFGVLEKEGLAKVVEMRDEDDPPSETSARLDPTEKGYRLLKAIGFPEATNGTHHTRLGTK